MRMVAQQARDRLAASGHGVLATVHPVRGVDAVPVVYAVDPAGVVGIPVDLVKAKTTTRLQRERNLEADPRATLLIEHWDASDWSRLWWVRAELRRIEGTDAALEERLAGLLSQRFGQYADRPFAGLLLLRIVAVRGWTAEG
ncbi:MAG: pyridoxamine 5'-phosphate oxidase family protein [Tetrasphaera sp.]|jgi:hypothetical protein|nr:pyridoxamine 5'-phosphate oxidase family protein [Tetrasphaera sp.]